MKYEWYPWNPSRYRADTMHLTAEQDGIYRRLIDHYMETELPLPDNDLALARIAGVSEECFKQAASTLKAFFKQEDGKLYHKKCEEVLTEMDERSRKRSERAKKGGEARAKKVFETKEQSASSTAQAEHKNSLNVLSNLTLPNKTEKKEKINKKEIQYSEKFLEFWEAYPRHRRGNKEKSWYAWKSALDEDRATEDQIVAAAKSYAKSEQGRGEFAKGAAAWLNDDRWNYEIDLKSIKIEKEKWHPWQHQLAKIIGSAAVQAWFWGAEVREQTLFVSKSKFAADFVRSNYLTDLEKVFERQMTVIYKPPEQA